jgi:hypothetical protein
MHGDVADRAIADDGPRWSAYFDALRASGAFDGGSSIGPGASHKLGGAALPVTATLTGFIRVRAADLADARRFLVGNPIYDAGGTIEIRELPRDG